MNELSADERDDILARQILVAWAGEGRCKPPRLGWWSTDLVDEYGGGDFFERLLPTTHEWAALDAVRQAARRRDEEMRNGAAEPDELRSLYHLSPEVDRQIDERLTEHKRAAEAPAEALPLLTILNEDFDRDALAATLRESGSVDVETTPAGRRIKGTMPDDFAEATRNLAAALVPFPDDYPQPHYRLR